MVRILWATSRHQCDNAHERSVSGVGFQVVRCSMIMSRQLRLMRRWPIWVDACVSGRNRTQSTHSRMRNACENVVDHVPSTTAPILTNSCLRNFRKSK